MKRASSYQITVVCSAACSATVSISRIQREVRIWTCFLFSYRHSIGCFLLSGSSGWYTTSPKGHDLWPHFWLKVFNKTERESRLYIPRAPCWGGRRSRRRPAGCGISPGRHLILELENFRANLELQFYRFIFIFKSNTFFWENEALHI